MVREGGSVSPDGLRAKPLLIGNVKDAEQVQERVYSSQSLSAAPTSLFGFVLLCQLLPFDVHVLYIYVLFMPVWSNISQDHLAVACKQ